jgi:4-hydroxybenzoate polyprenyltransferase
VELVSAADRRVVEAVAGHLDLFDAAHGSDGRRNLGGAAKAEFLVERFGEGGFDYLGDHANDLAVWARARRALLAGARPGTERRARAEAQARGAPDPERLDAPPPAGRRALAYLRALRPHQWLKNLLIFLPLLAAHGQSEPGWSAALLAFVAFSLTASAVYCLNDLMDLEADRAHPRKRARPFASGDVPVAHGAAVGIGLLVAGFGLGYSVSPLFFGVLTVYFGATSLYSLALKRELVIDICMLAGLYTLRVLAGSVAAELQLSPWMLALSVFLFLALAAMKRQTELVDMAREGRSESAGRAYIPSDLPVVTMMAVAAGYTAVLVLALYIYSPAVQRLYVSPLLLWGAPPILLYWVSRMVMIAHRGEMEDDPVLFAVRDGISLACGAGILAVGLTAKLL